MATPAKRKKPEDEKEFNLTLAEVEATGAELGISISVNEPPKKVGRPRKSEGEKKQRSPTGRPRGRPRIYPKDSTPKEPRPRGRPRIHPPKDPSTKRSRKPPAQSAAKKTNGDSEEENGHESKVLSPSPGSFKFKIVLKDRSKAKASPGRPPVNGSPAKKPGRPRIHPPKEGPKKPRGRPRIHPPKVGPKRPRGRPRRVPQETAVEVNIADKEEESQTPQSVEPETESTPQE